jgi:hypothetical protein
MHGSFTLAPVTDLKNPVNQWLCIAFICLICFWVVLYYFVNRTEAVGNSLAQSPASSYRASLEDALSR